jgi:hypothetical protein
MAEARAGYAAVNVSRQCPNIDISAGQRRNTSREKLDTCRAMVLWLSVSQGADSDTLTGRPKAADLHKRGAGDGNRTRVSSLGILRTAAGTADSCSRRRPLTTPRTTCRPVLVVHIWPDWRAPALRRGQSARCGGLGARSRRANATTAGSECGPSDRGAGFRAASPTVGLRDHFTARKHKRVCGDTGSPATEP